MCHHCARRAALATLRRNARARAGMRREARARARSGAPRLIPPRPRYRGAPPSKRSVRAPYARRDAHLWACGRTTCAGGRRVRVSHGASARRGRAHNGAAQTSERRADDVLTRRRNVARERRPPQVVARLARRKAGSSPAHARAPKALLPGKAARGGRTRAGWWRGPPHSRHARPPSVRTVGGTGTRAQQADFAAPERGPAPQRARATHQPRGRRATPHAARLPTRPRCARGANGRTRRDEALRRRRRPHARLRRAPVVSAAQRRAGAPPACTALPAGGGGARRCTSEQPTKTRSEKSYHQLSFVPAFLRHCPGMCCLAARAVRPHCTRAPACAPPHCATRILPLTNSRSRSRTTAWAWVLRHRW
jgi:hypothetical protein